MLAKGGFVPLGEFHFDRLFRGMRILGLNGPMADVTDGEMSVLSAASLASQTSELCRVNGHMTAARVRLTVFAGEGGKPAAYIIQTSVFTGDDTPEGGLRLGYFPDARKSCDRFSNLKSSSYLPYALAARYAGTQGWDDALVLNSREGVADSSIANLFYIRDGIIYTPPLSEGCVEGVMRRLLLERLPGHGFEFRERAVAPEELQDADEIFLTNALRGIRRVGSFEGKTYPGEMTRSLQEALKFFF